MSYRELQSILKSLRQQGFPVNVKLNSTKAVLQAEYDRIHGNTQEPAKQDDELAAAKARIAELEEQLRIKDETIALMAQVIQAAQAEQPAEQQEQQPEQPAQPEAAQVTEVETVDIDEQRVLDTIVKHGNYATFEQLGTDLNLTPKQLQQVLDKLAIEDVVELSKLAEPREYTVEKVEKWGHKQYSGGYLFFATVNEVEAANNAKSAGK